MPPQKETPPAGQGCGGAEASARRCELGLQFSEVDGETQTCPGAGSACYRCATWDAMLARFIAGEARE